MIEVDEIKDEIKKLAADVNEDNEIDIIDLSIINKTIIK